MSRWASMSIEERRVAALKLYNAGLSYSRVGVQLGASTNAIAGCIHRAKEAGCFVRTAGAGARSLAAKNSFVARKLRKKRKQASEPKSRGRQKTSAMTGLAKPNPKPPVPVSELRDIPLQGDEERTDLILFADRHMTKACAWPMSEPTADMLCCGRKVQKHFQSPYCTEHAERSMPAQR